MSRKRNRPDTQAAAATPAEQPLEGGRYIRDPATGRLAKLPPGAEQQRALDHAGAAGATTTED